MTGNLDNIVNLRVSNQSVDMARELTGIAKVKKSEINRMAHILGLELMDEIKRSGGEDDLLINTAQRIETLVKMRHYDEISAQSK